MSLGRQLVASFGDWLERLGRLTTRQVDQAGANVDDLWWRTLDESVVGRSAHAVTTAFRLASGESRIAQELRKAFRTTTIGEIRFVGVTGTVAPIVHVLLMWSSGQIGFWWLIAPAIALTFGALALGLSMGAARR